MLPSNFFWFSTSGHREHLPRSWVVSNLGKETWGLHNLQAYPELWGKLARTSPNVLRIRKLWESIKLKCLSAKFGFTDPPEKSQKWGKTVQISRRSSKLTLFPGGGGGDAILWTTRFHGHLGVSERNSSNKRELELPFLEGSPRSCWQHYSGCTHAVLHPYFAIANKYLRVGLGLSASRSWHHLSAPIRGRILYTPTPPPLKRPS